MPWIRRIPLLEPGFQQAPRQRSRYARGMRAAAGVLLIAATAHAGGLVESGAAHEVVHVGPPADPIRGPRLAPVTLDLYATPGHAPSLNLALLARRAVERAHAAGLDDVREVVHLLPAGSPGPDLA